MLFSRQNPPDGYYVYFYLRTDGTPYYVGKGKGVRAWVNHRTKNKKSGLFNGVQTPSDLQRIVIVHHQLTLVGSLALERRWIRWYGRKDIGTGILRNLTDGGDGGDNPSPETIEKGAAKRRGVKKGPASTTRVERYKESVKGKVWWNNGEIKVSAVKCPGPEWVRGKGIKIWNNGKEEKQQIKCPGPGWVEGTIKVMWNNGVEMVKSVDCPGPEWVLGRTEQAKKNNGDARKGRQMDVVTCPVCGATGGANAMRRFHFDNCGKSTVPSRGKKAYNKDGVTKFFTQDPGDGWARGSHIRGEAKNHKSPKTQKLTSQP